MTQQDAQKHQIRQADINQFIQVLTPLSGINEGISEQVKDAANKKLLELIEEIDLEPKKETIRPLTSLGRA